MNQTEQQEHDKFKCLYQKDLIDNMVPILPAYYYYLNHTDKIDVLSQDDFEDLFLNGLKSFVHPITLEQVHAYIDIDEVLSILNGYYDIRALTDKAGNFIKFV